MWVEDTGTILGWEGATGIQWVEARNAAEVSYNAHDSSPE